LLSVFVCHPERLCYSGALEQWMYGNGVNRGRSAVPPGIEVRHDHAAIQRALNNFRTLIRHLRDAPELNPMTVQEMVRRYGARDEHVSRIELAELARRAVANREIVIGETASAAEALLGFAESLTQLAGGFLLPENVTRFDVLGPTEPPPLVPELPALTPHQLASLAQQVLSSARQTGHLPDAVSVDGRRLGLGSIFGVLAEAYDAACRGDQVFTGAHQTAVWPRYPAPAVPLGERLRVCEEDPLMRPGLSTDAIARHTRLQTWTLKPAQRR
jgi:hypothetical protein